MVRGAEVAMNRRKVYVSFFSARALCITGLFILPALLFNPVTELRVIQFLFFWFLVWLSGGKSSTLVTFLVIAGITAFNLLIPYGRVLFSVGPLKITEGALRAGIHRAVTLEALVMLSRVSIRQDLQIPGAFGGLLSESLRIFSSMTMKKYRVTGKNLIAEIDRLMLDLSDEVVSVPADQQTRTKPAGYVMLAATAILSWLPWVRLLF
jgi:heptaprenyl diphosphate synthase